MKRLSSRPGCTREIPVEMLNGDLAGEYQAIIVQEREHEIDLCAALGVHVPVA